MSYPKQFIAQILSLCLVLTPALAQGFDDGFSQPDQDGLLENANNPSFGNDRIIFAAFTNSESALKEGLRFKGTLSGAKKMCLRAKAAFEKRYKVGICDKIDAEAEANSWSETITDLVILRWNAHWLAGSIAGAGLICIILFARNKLKEL